MSQNKPDGEKNKNTTGGAGSTGAGSPSTGSAGTGGAGTGATDLGTTRDTSGGTIGTGGAGGGAGTGLSTTGGGAPAAAAGGAATGAARGLADQAKEYSQKVADVASTAKDYLTDKAGVVGDKFQDLRNKDYQEMAENAKQYARSNPGQALLVAAAAGFVIGLLLRGGRK